MKAFLEDDCLCVVGNTKKIEEEKNASGHWNSCFEARGCPDKSSVQPMEHIHNGKLRRVDFHVEKENDEGTDGCFSLIHAVGLWLGEQRRWNRL